MRVLLPSPLFSYTGGQLVIDANGQSLAHMLEFVESRYPEMRHRMIDEQDRVRPHIRFFVNGDGATRMDHRLRADDEVIIVAALSGGRHGLQRCAATMRYRYLALCHTRSSICRRVVNWYEPTFSETA